MVQRQFIVSLQGRIHRSLSPFCPVPKAFSSSNLNPTLQVKTIILCPVTSRESGVWVFWVLHQVGFWLSGGVNLFEFGFLLVCFVWGFLFVLLLVGWL